MPNYQERFKVHICPYCYEPIKIAESLWEQDHIVCPNCKNAIRNPVKEDEFFRKINRAKSIVNLGWTIFWGLILIVLLYAFFSTIFI